MGAKINIDIQKRRLRWFGHVMRMREKRINDRKRPRGRPRTRCINKIRKDIEMIGGNWEEIRENRKWEIREGWRFFTNSRPIFRKMIDNADILVCIKMDISTWFITIIIVRTLGLVAMSMPAFQKVSGSITRCSVGFSPVKNYSKVNMDRVFIFLSLFCLLLFSACGELYTPGQGRPANCIYVFGPEQLPQI